MKRKGNIILLAFLAMGFGDVVGPMVSLAKQSFSLSNAVAQLLPFGGFVMYGLLSIPVGIFQAKKSKKLTLLVGLSIALLGLIFPMLNGMYGNLRINEIADNQFIVVLIAIILLGAGATFVQVAGNPIMRDVSTDGSYSRNLTLGQTVKAIGSSMGFLLPPFLLMNFGIDWTILFPIYALFVFISIMGIGFTKIDEKKGNTASTTLRSCLMLVVKNRYVLRMTMAIFFYVGAEIAMSSGIPILLKETHHIQSFGLLVSWSLFFLPIMLGRFMGSIILKWVEAKKLLIFSVAMSFAGMIMLLAGSKAIGLTGIFLIGLGFANIFPLIFSIAIDAMPERTNELSGLMITAIIGGAIIPFIMGFVQDKTNLLVGFVVPLVCVLYVAFVSFKALEETTKKIREY